MKKIALSGPSGAGLSALVDDRDYERLSRFRWFAHRAHRSLTVYARTTINGRHRYLHQEVLGHRDGWVIDHIDGNGLNNTRDNLQHLTHQRNVRKAVADRALDAWMAEQKAAGF